MPADTVQLISLTLGQPWNGAEAESLKRISSLHPVIPSWHLKDMPTNVGVDPNNIERLIQLSTPGQQVSLVRTLQPYDREKVLAAFVPAATEKSAGGKSYFHSATSTNSIYLIDERTMLLGIGQDLEAFLTQPNPTEHDASLDTALKAIEIGAPFVVHVGPVGVRAIAADQQLPNGPFAALAKAHAWQIIAEIDKGLTINLVANFASEQDASNSTAALSSIGEKLSGIMPFYKENMVPFLKEQESQFPGASELAPKMATAIDAAAEAVKNVKVASKNNRAGARIVLKTDEPLTTATLLLTLTPRGREQ